MKTVTAVLLGAGQRGMDAYAIYALQHPNELKFLAVAEPDREKRELFQHEHGISEDMCFTDWKELLEKPKLADWILICTQDKMHFEPMKEAMEKGYHILCEKPVTPDKEELLELKKMAENYDGVISVAHVLRYSPFFVKIKELFEGGKIGRLINIQHMEAVGYWHMAHSFVRGNWRNSEESCPMILAKCCHDFDILSWLIGKKCESLSSIGERTLFREENAPAGAPKRCTDGCLHRDECPFYAPRFYMEHPAGLGGFRRIVTLKEDEASLMEALKTGPYGRCVYHCDNDVVDHQLVNMQFEEGITASLTMTAFTANCERVIKLQGSRGQIHGYMEDNRIEYTDFASGNKEVITVYTPPSGHSGSDSSMMKSLTELVAEYPEKEDKSSAAEAIESHLMALAAEESRKQGGAKIRMEDFRG